MNPLVCRLNARFVEARYANKVTDSIQKVLTIRKQIVMQQDQHTLAPEAIEPRLQVVRIASRVEQLTMAKGGALERGFGISNPPPQPIMGIETLRGIAQRADYAAIRQIVGDTFARERRVKITRSELADRQIGWTVAKIMSVPLQAKVIAPNEKLRFLGSFGQSHAAA